MRKSRHAVPDTASMDSGSVAGMTAERRRHAELVSASVRKNPLHGLLSFLYCFCPFKKGQGVRTLNTIGRDAWRL